VWLCFSFSNHAQLGLAIQCSELCTSCAYSLTTVCRLFRHCVLTVFFSDWSSFCDQDAESPFHTCGPAACNNNCCLSCISHLFCLTLLVIDVLSQFIGSVSHYHRCFCNDSEVEYLTMKNFLSVEHVAKLVYLG